jgi:hypothetical protein
MNALQEAGEIIFSDIYKFLSSVQHIFLESDSSSYRNGFESSYIFPDIHFRFFNDVTGLKSWKNYNEIVNLVFVLELVNIFFYWIQVYPQLDAE